MRILLAVLCLALAPLSAALADDPYMVTGVEIDATAGNALEAQTLAIQRGQRDAARRLVERLTLAEDRAGTPLDMSGGFQLDDAIVAELISGLQIRDEQRSATRYLGKLDVGFDRRSVARVMAAYGVPFVESPSRASLVLPVYESENGFLLWEDNPWRAAWHEQNFRHALTPMAMPDPATTGPADITARQALELDEAALRGLTERLGVSRVAVLRAGERGGARRFGGYLVEFTADGAMTVDTWGPQSVHDGWRAAARRFVEERETAWKQQSVVRDTETTEMRVTVLYDGLPEWRRLQTALSRASLVTNAQLDALSRDGAQMTVNYRGEFGQLVSELAVRGARLEDHPELGWVVLSAR